MARNFGDVTDVTQNAAVGLELLHTAIHDVFDGEFQRTGVGEEKLVVVFLHFQHTGDKKIGMDYHVRHGFSHGFMDRGVVYAFHSFSKKAHFCQVRCAKTPVDSLICLKYNKKT